MQVSRIMHPTEQIFLSKAFRPMGRVCCYWRRTGCDWNGPSHRRNCIASSYGLVLGSELTGWLTARDLRHGLFTSRSATQ